MKFIINRTSDNKEQQPCVEAKKEKIPKTETYYFTTPEDFNRANKRKLGDWFSTGTNHRINERGYITRDNGFFDVWTIEINTLEELVKFVDKYGDCIIKKDIAKYKGIEIYDDYRE